MPRRRTCFIMAALGGIGIIIAAYAMTQEKQAPALEPTAAKAQRDETDAGAGQHGGVLLKNGPLTLEVVLAEKPGDARLIVYPARDGKPLSKDVVVSASVTRYDGQKETLAFQQSGQKYMSTEAIAKPHVFDAIVNVKGSDGNASFEYARTDGAVALSEAQLKTSKIDLAKVGPAQIATSFQLPGEIKFNEDRTAHVVPRVAGIVERVDVSIGQNVKKGQVLAVIASTGLADLRSELLTAERRLSAARTTYDREQTLWKERVSAEQDFLQAQVQLREAEIAAQNARQKLAAINAAAGAGSLNQYELRAPFSGTVIEKHATPGEAIAADANVFVISDLSSVWAEMAVPAQRLNDVRVGREATVSAAAFESASRGPIAYVGALLGEQTRTAPARVVLPNPNGAWRPGMFVNVSVDAGTQDVPIAVATDALQDVDGTPSVFVQSAKGFVAQAVETGRRDERVTEVVRGLYPGQQYVAANSFVLKAELGKGSAEEE
ncbi:RND family efflux transporter MFP subunit (plasmid) [Burkholderia sp. YI23]|nr:RND family efflux transporter MFP subunit [Burkholderia sp. YI23]